MILFSILIAVISIVLTWFVTNKRFKALLKDTLQEAQKELLSENEQLKASLKDVTQKNADLEYLLKEKEKDLSALLASKESRS